jgi:hypothetical protein
MASAGTCDGTSPQATAVFVERPTVAMAAAGVVMVATGRAKPAVGVMVMRFRTVHP